MKKIIFFFITALCVISVSSFAQNGGGNVREMMKQRLKDSLQLTTAQIDSVTAIQQEYQPRIRQLRTDTNLDEESKKTEITTIRKEIRTRLKTVLSEEQITKLEEMEATMRRQKLKDNDIPKEPD